MKSPIINLSLFFLLTVRLFAQDVALDTVVTISTNWGSNDSSGMYVHGLTYNYTFFCNGLMASQEDGHTMTIYGYRTPDYKKILVQSYSTYWDGTDLNSYSIYDYDHFGNQIRITHHNSDSVVTGFTEYLYDENNNRLETNLYHGSGTLIRRSVYAYDSINNMTFSQMFDSLNTIIFESHTSYDYANNSRENHMYGDDGLLDSRTISFYNDSGTVTRQIRYNYFDQVELYSITISEYDDQRNMLSWENFDKDSIRYQHSEYFYDENDNLIERNNYSNDILTSKVTHEYIPGTNLEITRTFGPGDSLISYDSSYTGDNSSTNSYSGDSVWISSSYYSEQNVQLSSVCLDINDHLGIDSESQNKAGGIGGIVLKSAPNTGHLQIIFTQDLAEELKVKVTNMQGRTLSTFEIPKGTKNYSWQPVYHSGAGLPTGAYLMNFKNTRVTKSLKFYN